MIADIAVDNEDAPTVIKIHLKRTENTQFSGVDVYLGSTGNELCPVAALMVHIAMRGMSTGPLFRFQSGRFLTKETFITRVREGLDILGLCAANYAGHSFRIGAVTTAAPQRVEDSMIEDVGKVGEFSISAVCEDATTSPGWFIKKTCQFIISPVAHSPTCILCYGHSCYDQALI